MDTKKQKNIKSLLKIEKSKASPLLFSKFENGIKWTLENGDYHREFGPAIIYGNGSKEWWVNGKRHREDGPAIIYVLQEDRLQYWILGHELTEEEFRRWILKNKKK